MIAFVELQEAEVRNLIESTVRAAVIGTKIKDATAQDPVLEKVLRRIAHGWKNSDKKDSSLFTLFTIRATSGLAMHLTRGLE